MPNYSVTMIRPHMDQIPEFPLPPGFGIRNYRPEEGYIWTQIQQASEPLFEIDDQLFHREFGQDYAAMEDRCFFLITDWGEEIGTTTAWWQQDWRGQEWGRIHWVAIIPDHQGKRLSKPMMNAAMQRLKASHDRCFLTTSSKRTVAIKVYLDFGCRPDLESENSHQAWAQVGSVLNHPILKEHGF